MTNENPNKVIGTVWRQDVISVYNRESLKYNLADGLAHEIKKTDRTISSTVAKGYSIVERKAKKDFLGKSLKDLKIRNQYSLEILMIKQEPSPFEDYESQETHIIVPDPDYIIRKNDILVLFGADDKIAQTVNWDS